MSIENDILRIAGLTESRDVLSEGNDSLNSESHDLDEAETDPAEIAERFLLKKLQELMDVSKDKAKSAERLGRATWNTFEKHLKDKKLEDLNLEKIENVVKQVAGGFRAIDERDYGVLNTELLRTLRKYLKVAKKRAREAALRKFRGESNLTEMADKGLVALALELGAKQVRGDFYDFDGSGHEVEDFLNIVTDDFDHPIWGFWDGKNNAMLIPPSKELPRKDRNKKWKVESKTESVQDTLRRISGLDEVRHQ